VAATPDEPRAHPASPAETSGAGGGDPAHLADVLRGAGDPTRLRILSVIAGSDGGEACVDDLVTALDLRQPTVSHHLRALTEAGLVQRDKRGTYAWYSITPAYRALVEDLLR
jgi:ArsR family transcriptional regulator